MKLDTLSRTLSQTTVIVLWCSIGILILGVAAVSCWFRKCRSSFRKKRKKHVKRTLSAAEFNTNNTVSVANNIYHRGRSVSSEHDNNSEYEHSEKSPLVTVKLDSLAKFLFNRSLSTTHENLTGGNKNLDTPSPSSIRRSSFNDPTIRNNTRYQYIAVDTAPGTSHRNPRGRASRDLGFDVCQLWTKGSNGRYEIIAHLDDIGSRYNKQWFLLSDNTVRTDRLLTLLPVAPDCAALDELPPSECPKGVLMELLGSLHHPYIYPVLDLDFIVQDQTPYACLVMPLNPKGSLKDIIFNSQWNEPWNRKYTRKSKGLPLPQIQRLGRQILEALLFLSEQGFPSHGHLHSGNIIVQNGVARLSGLENGLLGLNSRVNAIIWSQNTNDVRNIDIICFGHLLYEMCTGCELNAPKPTYSHLENDLEHYPQVAEVLQIIFDYGEGRYPTIEELVLCDLFRNIDLRELRGPSISSFKHNLSSSTLNLLQAVRQRQNMSLSGSHSEGSSPSSPPTTPLPCERRARTVDSIDATSDFEYQIDEIGICSNYMNSPNHCYDNTLRSDQIITSRSFIKESVIDITEIASSVGTSNASGNKLTTDSCVLSMNTKSRRMEYSKRGMKHGRSNPSQDSAFGSMTDGEFSTASSFRLNSFQSVSSPIEECVEDKLVTDVIVHHKICGSKSATQIDSAISSPCKESSSETLRPDEWNRDSDGMKHHSEIKNTTSAQNLYFDPPKILVNDQSSIYTTSPSKRNGSIEVFSQKYRVCSFEDMSIAGTTKKYLKSVSKMSCRSLEEERRIESAFQPIKSASCTNTPALISPSSPKIMKTPDDQKNRVTVTNQEKFKKLTHATFSSKISSHRDTAYPTTSSMLKSNGTHSCDYHSDGRSSDIEQQLHSPKTSKDQNQLLTKVNRPERFIFNLSKLKQTAITDCFYEDDLKVDNNKQKVMVTSSSSYMNLTNEPYRHQHQSEDNSSESSPSHQEVCQSIGGITVDSRRSSADEKAPLLNDMEMSPISPTDINETL